MNIIVFDLETTVAIEKWHSQYIIEISAVKIDSESQNITDEFQKYVKPPKNIGVGKSTRKMIGATKEDMENSLPLPIVIEQFKEWIGHEKYYLCSWGDDDLRILVNNYIDQRFDFRFMNNYNNIQKPISYFLMGRERVSLKEAMRLSNVEKTGKFHSGLADAIHTAKILITNINSITLHTNDYKNIFSVFSCPIYNTCKMCNIRKYATHFFIKKNLKPINTCLSCQKKRREKNKELKKSIKE